MSIEPFTIRLANPRGFCAGVDRAIAIVERALDQFGAPIYVRHEVVHNKHVVETLTQRGAVFVEEIDEIPAGSTCIFSAHGVSKAVEKAAEDKGLHVFDATCPLVTKVHMEVAKAAKESLDVILIGHEGHPEVEGTLGQMPSDASSRALLIESPEDVDALTGIDPDRLQFVTQTTLSVDDTEEVISALRKRFPKINGPRKDDICYATQNRQDAVKALAKESELILVVGSKNSSNSNRLRELAERLGARAFLIDRADEVEKDWLRGIKKVGVTSGASAPEVLVQAVIHRLEEAGGQFQGEIKVAEETVEFSLPKALR
ncbi:MAG: 4-hydroxy-3-methylbut-2-enyl diphosphate reductase [Pseudomonadales bacterium]